ncbi:hypothetical protein Ccrd_007763 [Cynara cardunculus var. scolymus]|uniref:DUF7731 domain-containing protein n=1 Tax=Cynara cardunculus var. scolymus TaxID=59895 RepID=A0A118JTP2_CYNCS|nr:hypothetical protein Ccrd_007763 [Cynara cardunculus var. scolymus]
MASSVFVKQWLLAMMLLFIVLFCFKSGKAETGIAGTGIGYIPEPGGGARDSGGDEPEEVIVKALECFSDKHIEKDGGVRFVGKPHLHYEFKGYMRFDIKSKNPFILMEILNQLYTILKQIYSSCEESYRLTERGQLNVPPEFADEYCNGPCLKETHLVLNCINDILTHFVFYNHATIKDVKETIKVGCGYGPHRGDFNVAEHIESNSYQHLHPILFGVTSLILLCSLLLF